MLSKVHIPDGSCSAKLLEECCTLAGEAEGSNLAPDATSKGTLKKLRDALLKQMRAAATAERGGDGADETVLDTTEAAPGAEVTETEGDIMNSFDEDAEDVDNEDVNQATKTLKDTTLGTTTFGATTIGAPDAEGTRVQLGVEDTTDMMEVDGEEYTEV
jgi:condensin complex subunit 3